MFGRALLLTGDALLDTYLPEQTRLVALRDDLDSVFANPGCEDARSTADTVRDIVRSLTTHLTEVEQGAAAGYLGFTCDNPLEG